MLFNIIPWLSFFSLFAFCSIYDLSLLLVFPFLSLFFFFLQIQHSSMLSSSLIVQKRMTTSCISSSVRRPLRWVRLPWLSPGLAEFVWCDIFLTFVFYSSTTYLHILKGIVHLFAFKLHDFLSSIIHWEILKNVLALFHAVTKNEDWSF